MIHRVSEIISRYNMLIPGARVGVAVSGGADSVCLLHILRELAAERQLSLAVVHLNHRLRDADSDADEVFVRNLAKTLRLPFYSDSVCVRDLDPNLEQAGRQARLAFFRRLMESGVVGTVATGHTQSDQAETVLYRILRGSGTSGLRGIAPVTPDGVIRPLLSCSRPMVLDYLTRERLSWREDKTNQNTSFIRNRLRHELIPTLERDYNPLIQQALNGLAEVARDEEEFWEQQVHALAGRLLEKRGSARVLRVEDLLRQPRAVARRFIRYAISSVKGNLRSISYRHVEALLNLAVQPKGHGRVQAPGLDVLRSFEWLRFDLPHPGEGNNDYSFQGTAGSSFVLPGSEDELKIDLAHRNVASEREFSSGRYTEEEYWLSAGLLGPRLEVRNWRPGDAIMLREQPERIKLLFQKGRVPIWDRQTWPVMTSAGVVVWTRRFGVAGGFAPAPEDGKAVRLTLRKAADSLEKYSSESIRPTSASVYLDTLHDLRP